MAFISGGRYPARVTDAYMTKFKTGTQALFIGYQTAEGPTDRAWPVTVATVVDLKKRLEELVAERPLLLAPLDAALQAASALPSSDWSSRLHEPEPPDLDGVEPARPNPTDGMVQTTVYKVAKPVIASTDTAQRVR